MRTLRRQREESTEGRSESAQRNFSYLPSAFFASFAVLLLSRAFAKNHPPRGSLQHAGDVDLHLFANVLAAPFDDDHRAIVEIANALTDFFARFDDSHEERF